jgi:hypothetical protein
VRNANIFMWIRQMQYEVQQFNSWDGCNLSLGCCQANSCTQSHLDTTQPASTCATEPVSRPGSSACPRHAVGGTDLLMLAYGEYAVKRAIALSGTGGREEVGSRKAKQMHSFIHLLIHSIKSTHGQTTLGYRNCHCNHKTIVHQ